MEKEKVEQEEQEHDQSIDAMEAVEHAAVQMDIEASDRKWLKDLTKTFVNISETSDESGNREFVVSQRVSYARDMAMVAIFDRIARIARSDMETPSAPTQEE